MCRVVFRKAFSLIELVISIVIIGIVAASFPMIMSQTNNNLAFAMRQEAVLATKTYIGTILSYDWDPIAKYSDGGNPLSSIVVSTGSNDFEINLTAQRRFGHVDATGRRHMYLNSTTGALVRADTNVSADVPNTPLILTVAPSDWDYIAELRLTPEYDFMNTACTDCDYTESNLSFNATANNFFSNTLGVAAVVPSDIKRIRVTTTNNSQMLTRSGIDIVLSVFTSNIGKMEFYSKEGSQW